MGYERCEVCKRWGWDHHKCPPLFTVWDPENGDEGDWKPVYATDHEDAAETFVEAQDCADSDYFVAGRDQPMTVFVRGEGDVVPRKFVVSGEMVPQYHASPADESDAS
jgi:hypothetical protein